MDREQVVQDYRRRIVAGERIKLTKAERAFLVNEFVGSHLAPVRVYGLRYGEQNERKGRESKNLSER